MEEVLRRGPNDARTWSHLFRRFELILPSFGHRHLSRAIVSLGKSGHCPKELIPKVRMHALSQLKECDLLSCCGILYGMEKIGVCDNELLSSFREQVVESIGTATEPYPVVILINIFASAGDSETTEFLLRYLLSRLPDLNPKALSIVLVAVVSNFGSRPGIENLLTPIVLKAAGCLGEMNLRSLCQIYSSVAKSALKTREHLLDITAAVISQRTEFLTVHQSSLILASAVHSRHLHSELIMNIMKSLGDKLHAAYPQQLLFILSSLLRLNMRDSSLVAEIAQQLSGQELGPTELANFVYMAAKWQMPQPSDGFLFREFQRLSGCFSLRDIALIAYGFSKMGNMTHLEHVMAVSEELTLNHEGPIDPRVLSMINSAAKCLRESQSKPITNSISPV